MVTSANDPADRLPYAGPVILVQEEAAAEAQRGTA